MCASCGEGKNAFDLREATTLDARHAKDEPFLAPHKCDKAIRARFVVKRATE